MKYQTIFKSNKIEIRAMVAGILSNNVYVIETAEESAVIDPSTQPEEIIDMCDEKSTLGQNSKVRKIILTHYHFDHIGAAHDIKLHYGAEVIASEIDAPYISWDKKPPMIHKRVTPCEVDTFVHDSDVLNIGETKWKVIETPGHTMGSICVLCEDTGVDKQGQTCPPILFCGDTLFKFSCGRTDFVDSDPTAMKDSLSKLAKLDNSTLVMPGHEDLTTINHERNFMLKNL